MDSGACVVHEDWYGTLYRQEIPGDEPLAMVRVRNATQECDGSFRHYFPRVPPEIERAQQAVAWTFGLSEDQYNPDIET